MSRKKKSRTTGFDEVVVVRQRSEADQLGRELKKQKKRKGLKTGTRNSEAKSKAAQNAKTVKDPRIGSKKPIPLIVEKTKAKTTKQERRMSAEKELEMLENDTQLTVLLERIENGEKLGAGLQSYVDEKLDRIEVLMKQLGLFEDEDENDDETEQTAAPAKAEKKAADDDVLSKFEHLNLDDFK